MSQKMLLVVCCTAALCSLGALWGCSESGTSPDNRDIMTLSTSSLEFTAWAGTNPNPAQQKVLVRIGGEGGANWTVSSPAFWLRLGPTGSDTIFVSVISIDLPIGIYRDTIVVQSLDASNSPVLLPVVLNVLNRLALTPQFLDFAALTGGSPPDTQTFLVADFAGNAVPYTATTAVDWIRLTNASGTTPETVSVIVDQTGLESGQYRDSIVVTSTELSESRVSLVCRLNISSWAAQDLGPGGSSINLESVGFVDPLTGWISGWLPSSADEPHGIVFRTTSGGAAWSKVFDRWGSRFGGLAAIDPATCWVVGDSSYVALTTDSGGSWTPVVDLPTDSAVNLRDVFFADEEFGVAVGRFGTVVCTWDSGQTWACRPSGTSFDLNCVFFANEEHGWIAGNHGTILRSYDGGGNWIAQPTGTIADLQGVSFITQYMGWAVGAGGTILCTVNGGGVWEALDSRVDFLLTAVFFSSATSGWVTGTNGMILHTDDGGLTWLNQPTEVEAPLSDVFFFNDSLGWAVGDNGTVLKTASGGF